MVWYAHLLKNFPQFIVIHAGKGFGINKAEVDVFLELSCFFDGPPEVGNFIFGSSAFSKTSLNIWKFMVHILLKAAPAAAAATSFQSCLTLGDPIDSSPPGSPSLGFSRQEHWNGLPFPSPMHESEK